MVKGRGRSVTMDFAEGESEGLEVCAVAFAGRRLESLAVRAAALERKARGGQISWGEVDERAPFPFRLLFV